MKSILNLDIDYSTRVFGLDLLRAYAILNVVLGHSYVILAPYLSPSIATLWVWAVCGLDGVDVFFVLSGFLIGNILLKIIYRNNGLSLKNILSFWKRRWYRTLPNYVFVLILNILLFLVLGKSVDIITIVPYFLFLQNLAYPHPLFFIEAWSLAVEEWFYLTTPLIVFCGLYLFKKKASINNILIGSITLIVVFSLSVRMYNAFVMNYADWQDWFRRPVIARLDAIIFGVISAFVKLNNIKRWAKYKHVLFAAGLIILALTFYIAFKNENAFNVNFKRTIYFTLTSLGIFCIMPFFDSLKQSKSRIGNAFTHVSLISYSLYLINYTFVLTLFQQFNYNNTPLRATVSFIVYWTLNILFATLMYKYIEKPVLEYRNRKVKEY